jgi:hypothetical protein
VPFACSLGYRVPQESSASGCHGPGTPRQVTVDLGFAVDLVHGGERIRIAPARAGAPCRLAGLVNLILTS